MNVIPGVLLHAVGALCASLCYTPEKKTVSWSWQTYWLAQAAVCWLLLPFLVAWITIPKFGRVLSEAPSDSAWITFLLGAAYGIGGTAFGIAIRYVGFSLTYAIAVGISCVLGTLLPPFVHGQMTTIMNKGGSDWLVAGIGLGIAGIALCGAAGRSKERDLIRSNNNRQEFSLAKGLPLCLLAGLLSAVYGFSLDQGQPIADIAFKYGAGNFQGNVIYIFSNTGAFLTTAAYCIYLHIKEKTFGEFIRAPKGTKPSALKLNFGLAAITGILWYSQFFFYGLGHVRMGEYKFSSWAVHMIMLVLFSALAGIVMKEWTASRPRTKKILGFAMLTLISAVLIITYGNYLGEIDAGAEQQ